MCDDEEDGLTVSGHAVATITIRLECLTDDDHYGVPDVHSFRLQTVVPDLHVTKSMNPERLLSAGYVLGMDLARVASKFRDVIADDGEIAAGFAREMQDWDKDHGRSND